MANSPELAIELALLQSAMLEYEAKSKLGDTFRDIFLKIHMNSHITCEFTDHI